MREQKNHFDVLIIGSGPGGEGASIKLAKSGKSVAIIESHALVGGGCTHSGTIPSKTLIHVVRQYSEAKKSRLFDRSHHHIKATSANLMDVVRDVVDQQVSNREGFYERNGVEVIEGHARFVDPQTVEVTDESDNSRHFTADNFVIATGSHPYRPKDINFDGER
ncbi:MAG: FAD-dependent oxidoreductase, partial [Desulfuromusa sp.]|nr:FAD-dependent oxidoreductase [Desulfuromusa sp.]